MPHYSIEAAKFACASRLKPAVGTVATGDAVVIESDPNGAGEVRFSSASTFLLVKPAEISTKWIIESKCADGAIIEFKNDGVHIHIVELKSKLDTQKWDHAKKQILGMFLHVSALLGAIGIERFKSVTAYVAYKEEAITAFLQTNTIALKRRVGAGKPLVSGADWRAGTIALCDLEHVKVVNIQRGADGNAAYSLS